MRAIAFPAGIVFAVLLVVAAPARAEDGAQAQAQKMQAMLRPWLDPTFEAQEGTDSNVREFVAKTTPEIRAALPPKLSAPIAKKRRVLVVTSSTLGALHVPGAAGHLILLREAEKKYDAFQFTEVFSDSSLDAQSLVGCDAVVLNGVSQLEKGGNTDFYNKVLPKYVGDGGGLLAVHGAALVFRHHPESPYNDFLGGFTTPAPVHPGKQGAVFPVKVVEPEHPLTAAFRGAPQTCMTKGQYLQGAERRLYALEFEAPANLADELYTFNLKSNRDGACRTLVAIDKAKLQAIKNGPQFPDDTPDFGYSLVWIKRHGKGRVFYTQLGHNFSVYSVRCVAQSLLDGLQYVVGDLAADDSPPAAAKPAAARPAAKAEPIADAGESFIVKDDKRFNEIVPRGAKLESLSCDFKALEGPVWIGGDDGILVFSEMKGSELKKWSATGGFETYRKNSFATNGNAVDLQGRIVSCEQGKRRIARVGDDGESIVLADNYEGKKLNCPNDVAIRSDGMIWFTDPRYSEAFGKQEVDGSYVYRFDPAKNELTIASKDFTHPNGICLSPDEKVLYVGHGGKGRFVKAYDIGKDNALTNGREICVVSDGVPDGLKCDSQGNLYVTSGKGVEIFTPTGQAIGTIKTNPRASNVCFGGQGRKTLFITGHNCLFRIELNVPGPKR